MKYTSVFYLITFIPGDVPIGTLGTDGTWVHTYMGT